MKYRLSTSIGFLITILALFWLSGCGGGLKSIESFEKLEPIEDLPQPTEDHNLVVGINNVADVGTSHKNWAELFINGKRIQLGKEVVGFQKDYHFHFELKSGVYKIKAIYYARAGLGEKEYKITTQDQKVRIYPDRRTVLSITLDKKLNGQLKSKKNFFEETTRPLSKGSSSTSRSTSGKLSQNQPRTVGGVQSSQTAIKVEGRPNRIVQNRLDNRSKVYSIKFTNPGTASANRLAGRSDHISLQINTIPAKANVFIDGKFVGTSPLKTGMSRGTNHLVQFTLDGFKEKRKVITATVVKNQKTLFITERLTRKQP